MSFVNGIEIKNLKYWLILYRFRFCNENENKITLIQFYNCKIPIWVLIFKNWSPFIGSGFNKFQTDIVYVYLYFQNMKYKNILKLNSLFWINRNLLCITKTLICYKNSDLNRKSNIKPNIKKLDSAYIKRRKTKTVDRWHTYPSCQIDEG